MQFKILFVDDDKNIINGVKRMMYPIPKEWQILYANGGKEALDVLNKKSVDVIISDIRMPGLDGTQLLQKVKNKFPQIVRITLSGYSNNSLALKNTKIVHQSLAKPTTAKNIKFTLERVFKLQQTLNNKELLKVINGINKLPSLPKIYIELEKEINSPGSSITRIANIISIDPVITAKILQLTNSAFFGLPSHVTNIKEALNYLGMKTIQTLVLTIKLFKSIDPKSPNADLYKNIFNHSKKVAFLAQQLSSISKASQEIIEETFISGLLHDIGKLIILEGIDGTKIIKNDDVKEYEKSFLNTSHAEIGAYLLGIWGLPNSIVEATAYHHYKNLQNFETYNTSSFVFTANNIVSKSNMIPQEINRNNISEIFNKYGKHYMEEE